MEDLHITERREPLFTNKALLALIIPLIGERFLDMTVGIADTLMVASVGEAAVSGISLIDNINNLIIFVLAALSTGGAVVVSQYLGRRDLDNARLAGRQLMYATTIASLALMIAAIVWRDPLLRFLFGALDADVMENAQVYFWITSLSYPFMAIFNSAAALYRSMGNSKISLFVSLLMNFINICGNAILIYGFGQGSAGAATASLVSRIVSAALMLILLRNPHNIISLRGLWRMKFQPQMIKNILRIGIPNGIENGMFHIGRLAVQNLITTFGTAAIAANAVAGRVMSLSQVPGSAIQLAIITVVGQCIGAGDYEQGIYYAKRLMKQTYLVTGVLCALTIAFAAPSMRAFNLSDDAVALGVRIIQFSSIFIAAVWPMAFPFANILRAAGDTKYTMIVSVASMFLVRVGMSYLLHYAFGLGLMGVWYAMCADWIVRGALFLLRYKSNKWRGKRVI